MLAEQDIIATQSWDNLVKIHLNPIRIKTSTTLYW